MNFEFHHVGVACRSIERAEAAFLRTGYLPESDTFEDPVQGVRGRFLISGGPRLELLEPLSGSTTLQSYLELQPRMYHLAFEVSDLDRAVEEMRADGGKLVSPPRAAVAFDGRFIAFLILPDRGLTELIERDIDG